ncbi:MAG: beta-lactamase family protein [Sphingomonadales bacterium]|nr:beta-lactamase family protein [Sphingomonadaceae bacterium]MBS3931844.1 beta-lactamase family protein [Sphingomonadales bacterium]
MKPIATALAALALLFHPALAWAGPLPADQLERIDAAARKALKDSGVPSVQVAVVKDGEVVLSRAWGKASETIPEAGPDLQYQIASNSKQFLAALFLILENDGKLDLDDPVSKWLPELPSGGKFDPAKFSENGRYFFNAQTLADYRQSLAPLGPLTGLELARPPRLRGGFVNRVFTLKFGKKELTLITYAEAGAQGRWEQFIVTP